MWPVFHTHWSIMPQLTVPGSPKPKKARAASMMMAEVTRKVMYRKAKGRTFGMMWRKMIRMWDAPATLAASMKGPAASGRGSVPG